MDTKQTSLFKKVGIVIKMEDVTIKYEDIDQDMQLDEVRF